MVAALVAAWTEARKPRKQTGREKELSRIARATSGDWAAVRELRRRANSGWDIAFAEANKGKDPHQITWRKSTPQVQVCHPFRCGKGNMEPFTQEELQQALSKGKPGKAVGVNQTHARVGRAFSGLLPFTTTFTPTSRCAPTGTRLSW